MPRRARPSSSAATPSPDPEPEPEIDPQPAIDSESATSTPLAVPESSGLAIADDAEPLVALPLPDGARTEVIPINGVSAAPPPEVMPDRGLYAVFGLQPSASDAEVQTAYRRQAAQLLDNGDLKELRRLNVAYEMLGNSARRAEYDRALRSSPSGQPVFPTPVASGAKVAASRTRRTRPRHAVQPRYAGFGDVMVVLMVVGVAIVAGLLIIPRVSINLSSLNALSNVLPASLTARRAAIEVTAAPVAASAAPVATPTVRPGLADRFAGSTVAISNASPARNSAQTIQVRLRRDGQPAANLDVYATLQYRTTEERWPATGTVKTDASGNASIPFNVGAATPGFQVQVHVFTQADDQQLSWSTQFTPR